MLPLFSRTILRALGGQSFRGAATKGKWKPWMNTDVTWLVRAWDSAFRSGDTVTLRTSRRTLDAAIKRAKTTYALKIQGHFNTSDPWMMWVGIRSIVDHSRNDAIYSKDPSLPDVLNTFHAHIEASKKTSLHLTHLITRWPATTEKVRRSFW